MKLSKRSVRIDARKLFYGNRIVDEWNRLNEDTVNADKVKVQKKVNGLKDGASRV